MAKSATPLRREAIFHKNVFCHLDRLENRFGDVLATIWGRPGGPRAAKSGPGAAQERLIAAQGQLKTRPRATLEAQESPNRSMVQDGPNGPGNETFLSYKAAPEGSRRELAVQWLDPVCHQHHCKLRLVLVDNAAAAMRRITLHIHCVLQPCIQ